MTIHQLFLGAVNLPVYLESAVWSMHNNTISRSGLRLVNDGTTEQQSGNTNTYLYDWMLDGAVADYASKWVSSSGNLSSGAEDTWQALSSTRTYNVEKTTFSPGTKICNGTLYIALAADTANPLISAFFELTADV